MWRRCSWIFRESQRRFTVSFTVWWVLEADSKILKNSCSNGGQCLSLDIKLPTMGGQDGGVLLSTYFNTVSCKIAGPLFHIILLGELQAFWNALGFTKSSVNDNLRSMALRKKNMKIWQSPWLLINRSFKKIPPLSHANNISKFGQLVSVYFQQILLFLKRTWHFPLSLRVSFLQIN